MSASGARSSAATSRATGLHEEQWAAAGWRLFVVWECELKPKVRDATLAALYDGIVGGAAAAYSAPAGDEGLLAAETPSEYEASKR